MESFKVFWENRNPQSTLLHYTSLINAVSILSENQFRLSLAHSKHEKFKYHQGHFRSEYNLHDDSKPYYFSMARSMTSIFIPHAKENTSGIILVFELDASKLSDKYEIIKL